MMTTIRASRLTLAVVGVVATLTAALSSEALGLWLMYTFLGGWGVGAFLLVQVAALVAAWALLQGACEPEGHGGGDDEAGC